MQKVYEHAAKSWKNPKKIRPVRCPIRTNSRKRVREISY
jgi:hypothetical protein